MKDACPLGMKMVQKLIPMLNKMQMQNWVTCTNIYIQELTDLRASGNQHSMAMNNACQEYRPAIFHIYVELVQTVRHFANAELGARTDN